MRQHNIHSKARHLENERMGNGHGLLIRRGIRPRDDNLFATQVASFFLNDLHQVGKNLKGMINVALHVEDGHARRFGDIVEVLIAAAPIYVANGNAIEITSINFANFFRGVAVRDLRRTRFNKRSMSAELRHPCFKRTARARGGEKEQHGENFVAEQCVRFAHRALALEVKREIEYSFYFIFREIEVADEITTA